MRALIDLQWMKPGYTGGIEIQGRAFLETLLELDFENHYTIILPGEVRYDFDLRGHQNIRVISLDGPGYGVLRALDLLKQRGKHNSPPTRERLLREMAASADVVLSISGYTAPAFLDIPNVLCVPDIQHEYFPEFFEPEELERRRQAFTRSIHGASHLCAISEFTRQTLTGRFGVPPEKITVTPLSADPIFQTHPNSEQVSEVRRKYRLPAEPYLYYPAATWPHKNHKTLLLALQQIREKNGDCYHLVCTGPKKEAQAEIERLIAELGLTGSIHFLGYVPRKDLPALYAGAALLVFPSLFEGFGLPVLEAMTCGVPVACSSATSLPEVAGDAALLFDPLSVDELAGAIVTACTDPIARADLIRKGTLQAAKFNWMAYTRQTLAVMEAAAGSPAGETRAHRGNGSIFTRIHQQRVHRAAQSLAAAEENWQRGRVVISSFQFIRSFFVGPDVLFHTRLFPALRNALIRWK